MTTTRTSVNQPPSNGTVYPFTEPTPLNDAVLDFYLSYQDDLCGYVMPFFLAVDGDRLTVTDNANVTVAEGALSEALSTPWADRTVAEWRGPTWVMRAVVRTLADGVCRLDGRTLNRTPGRVRSIRVGLQTFTGNVVIQAGYNIDLAGVVPEERADGGRFVNGAAMDVVVGAGMGRAPGCVEAEPLVRRINRIQPDASGNFVFELDSCFRGQPPVTVEETEAGRTASYGGAGLTPAQAKAALALSSDCYPCYDCSYFVRTYKGLKRVWERWKQAAKTAEEVRDTYEANRQRWLDQLQCRLEHPTRLVVMTENDCKTFVGGLYCNMSKCCISPVELRFTFQKFKAGVDQPWPVPTEENHRTPVVYESYVEGSNTDGEVKAVPLVSGPVVRFQLDYADPQKTSMAKFRICVPCASDESLRVTLTAHAPDPPPAQGTGEVCTLPTPDVPADVKALWNANGVPETPAVRAVEQKTVPLNPQPAKYPCEC